MGSFRFLQFLKRELAILVRIAPAKVLI